MATAVRSACVCNIFAGYEIGVRGRALLSSHTRDGRRCELHFVLIISSDLACGVVSVSALVLTVASPLNHSPYGVALGCGGLQMSCMIITRIPN